MKEKAESEYSMLFTEDLYDAVCLAHAALAQDAPEDERYYLNAILNMLWGYLPVSHRKRVENYMAEKEYFPTVKIIVEK